MNLKTIITAILLLSAMLGGCKKKDDTGSTGPFSVAVSGEGITFDGKTLSLGPDSRSLTFEIIAEGVLGKWDAVRPIDDTWCAFTYLGNQLVVAVSLNNTDAPRSTWIEFSHGEDILRIEVNQDNKRVLAFASGESITLSPRKSNVSLQLLTNIAGGELKASIEPADCDWMNPFVLSAKEVVFTISPNPSRETLRQAVITVTGMDQTASITVIQNISNTFPAVIELANATFDDCYIYEIWDEVSNQKIGELCKEYLHKNTGTQIVRMQAIVAYPMLDGKADLQNGLVVDNGYFLSWNPHVTAATPPDEILAAYSPGEPVSDMPPAIYLDEGASRMTTIDLLPAERIYAALRPMLLRDQRSGSPNTAGSTEEDFSYRIVKIGTQYWMADNLRTTRYADNGAPIPTNMTNAEWNNAMSPGCVIAFREPPITGTLRSFIDANNTNPEAIEMRNRVGVSYNFHAITRTTASFGTPVPTAEIVDRLSPEGWRIPVREHFQILLNYVYQSTALPLSAAELNGYSSNETGFSAIGNLWRMETGQYSSHTDFQIMTYTFRANQADVQNQHVNEQFRISTNTDPDPPLWRTNQTTMKASYVRCIRSE